MVESVQKSRLRRVLMLLQQRDVIFPLKTAFDYWLPSIIARRLYEKPSQTAIRLANKLSQSTDSPAAIRQAIKDIWPNVQKSYDDSAFLHWEDWEILSETRAAIDKALKNLDDPLIIAEIDTDGRVHCPYGILPYFEQADSASVPRQRTGVSIVYLDGFILICKRFYGDNLPLLREWYNLLLLHGRANVPAVYRVDEEKGILYKSMIVGHTLRDKLAAAGAEILNAQTDHDPALAGLTKAQRITKILARGTSLLSAILEPAIIKMLTDQMDRIHRNGIAHLSLTFGNVMLDEDNRPWFIDFENSFAFDDLQSWKFYFQQDQDRQKFNRLYNQQILTESTARVELRRLGSEHGSYAPVDLGNGLAMRGFWSVDSDDVVS